MVQGIVHAHIFFTAGSRCTILVEHYERFPGLFLKNQKIFLRSPPCPASTMTDASGVFRVCIPSDQDRKRTLALRHLKL